MNKRFLALYCVVAFLLSGCETDPVPLGSAMKALAVESHPTADGETSTSLPLAALYEQTLI